MMRWVQYVAEIIEVACFGILSPQKMIVNFCSEQATELILGLFESE
jgi:hypothetical protein